MTKSSKNIIYRIMPKYAEESLFVIAVTMILTSIGYQKFIFDIDNPFVLVGCFIGYILAIFVALIDEKFSVRMIGFVVIIAVMSEALIGIDSGFYWLTNPVAKEGLIGQLIFLSSIVNLAHSIVMIGVLRLKLIQPEKLFMGGHADKRLLAISTILIFAILIWMANYTDYPYAIINSIIFSANMIMISFKDFIVVND